MAGLNPGKPYSGENFSPHLAGMSKNQLYDVMSQMKTLIEQNQQQARQILVANPVLTKALFQAQIMLGMVQPPQVMPNIQQASSQQLQQSTQPVKPSNVQAGPPLPVQTGPSGQTSLSQLQVQARQHTSVQASMVAPPATLPSQSVPLHSMHTAPQVTAQHTHSHLNPQFSQTHSSPILPLHSTPQPLILQPPAPSLHTSGMLHQPLQPPLPPQPRPSMQPFSYQIHSQVSPNLGFQPSGPPQQHPSQPMFHSGINPPTSIGSSFLHGHLPLPSQPPLQQLYQVGSHMGADPSNQGGSSMQVERGGPWIPGPPESAIGGLQFSGPPPLISGQSGPRPPPPLGPEMQKALLQQVLSLTPEQINLLPPEQRHQVFQLQQHLAKG